MLYARSLNEKIAKFLDGREIIVVVGMRRVGKTSLIRLLQEQLGGEQTFYFDLEDFSTMEVCNKGPEAFIDYLKLLGADFSQRLYVAIGVPPIW